MIEELLFINDDLANQINLEEELKQKLGKELANLKESTDNLKKERVSE